MLPSQHLRAFICVGLVFLRAMPLPIELFILTLSHLHTRVSLLQTSGPSTRFGPSELLPRRPWCEGNMTASITVDDRALH